MDSKIESVENLTIKIFEIELMTNNSNRWSNILIMAQFHIILQLGNEFLEYELDVKGRILNHKFPRQKRRSRGELDPNAQPPQSPIQNPPINSDPFLMATFDNPFWMDSFEYW